MAAPRIAFLSGRYLPETEALVPASSDAVQYGASVFETLRVCRGRVSLWERHAARLARATHALALQPPALDVPAHIAELAARNGAADGVVRLTLSRDWLLLCWRSLPPELERELAHGVALATAEHRRELPAVKTGSRAALHALEQCAGGEVALCARGALLETTRSNLFLLRGGRLWTAPADRVLEGIAREWILEQAQAWGVPVTLAAPRRSALGPGAELFASNAVRGIRRIVTLDGKPLPAPAGDPLLARLQQALAAALRGE